MNNARLQAVKILKKVLLDQQSLSIAINVNSLEVLEQSLCKKLCFGVMREYFILEKIINNYLKKKLRKKDCDIYILLLLGVYQLLWLRIPDHAAINETVRQSNYINKTWAKKLLNAILRSVQKDKKILIYSIYDSHPSWIIDIIKRYYPGKLKKILEINQTQAPMSLRVNIKKIDRKIIVNNLKIPMKSQDKYALILSAPIEINKLPEFKQGLVSVQDAGFQHAASLLELLPNLTVLDACAAPGGKSGHILEIEPTIKLTALDNKQSRLLKIQENLQRLKITASVILGDARNWKSDILFDRILCDVPCSGLGIIRRHPDIKYLRSPDDIKQLLKTQMEILTNCWSLLKQDGILIYSTCSILPDENEQQIAKFVNKYDDVQIIQISNIDNVEQLTYGIQGLPNNSSPNHDGFYYAKLQKSSKLQGASI